MGSHRGHVCTRMAGTPLSPPQTAPTQSKLPQGLPCPESESVDAASFLRVSPPGPCPELSEGGDDLQGSLSTNHIIHTA